MAEKPLHEQFDEDGKPETPKAEAALRLFHEINERVARGRLGLAGLEGWAGYPDPRRDPHEPV